MRNLAQFLQPSDLMLSPLTAEISLRTFSRVGGLFPQKMGCSPIDKPDRRNKSGYQRLFSFEIRCSPLDTLTKSITLGIISY
jgi:hypothetical protein